MSPPYPPRPTVFDSFLSSAMDPDRDGRSVPPTVSSLTLARGHVTDCAAVLRAHRIWTQVQDDVTPDSLITQLIAPIWAVVLLRRIDEWLSSTPGHDTPRAHLMSWVLDALLSAHTSAAFEAAYAMDDQNRYRATLKKSHLIDATRRAERAFLRHHTSPPTR